MSETKPHLFISHATWQTNENQRTVNIRQCLFDLLNTEWEVFVDKERLKPGDKWRPAILHSLSNAQAGIILFDKTAVEKSDWVKAEALIMCFRQSIDPDFQLIPVLLDDLKPDNEQFKIYLPFQLGEITFQFDDPQKSVDAICREIVAQLKVEKARTKKNFRGWMWEFEGLLLDMKEATLIEAWSRLIDETSAVTIDSIDELRRAVVQLIHYSKPIKMLPAVGKLRRELTNEQIEKIKGLVKQKWIENESVEVVFSSTRNPRNKVLLIFYTPEDITYISQEFIKCLFSRLVSECPDNYKLIKRISVGEATDTTDVKVIRVHIENSIKENLGGLAYASDNIRYEQRIQANLSDPQKLTICYIPQKLARSEILKELHLSYPQLVFLVQINSDEDKIQFENSGGKNLSPVLDYDKIDEYDELCDQLENIFQ